MNYIIVNNPDSFLDKMLPVFIGALLAFLSAFSIQYFKNKYDKEQENILLKKKYFSELNYLDTYLTYNLHFHASMIHTVLEIKKMLLEVRSTNKLKLNLFGDTKPEKFKNVERLAFTDDKPEILDRIFNIHLIMDRLYGSHINLYDENIKKYINMPDKEKTVEHNESFINSIEYINNSIYSCLCKIIRDTSFVQNLVHQYCESNFDKKLPAIRIPIDDSKIIEKAISDADKTNAI